MGLSGFRALFGRTLKAVLVLLAAAPELALADDPRMWLSRMGVAAEAYDYDGVFIYAHDGRIETVEVERTQTADGAHERLVSLTGDRREVVRDGKALHYRYADGASATLEDSGAMPSLDPQRFLAAASHYALRLAGTDRIAGYPVQVLDARPADADRYGYRLWLERDSGVLLGAKRYAADGSGIEHVQFTTLSLKPAAIRPVPAAAAAAAAPLAGPRFAEGGLPAGFRLIAAPAAGASRQFVYSDGLANVSVYVDPLSVGMRALTGFDKRGAVHLFARVVGNAQIVVVGDVPARTAQRIALALEPGSATPTGPPPR